MNKLLTQKCITLIEYLKNSLRSGYLSKTADSKLVFVCGANHLNSKRTQFLSYAYRHFTNFHFFKAENFFECLENVDSADLITLENTLGHYSDCILVILESNSAFAELGAFANHEQLRKVLLVINDINFQNEPSYINHGPLKIVDKYSIFKPSVFADFDVFARVMSQIENKLNEIKRVNSIKLGKALDVNYFNQNPKDNLLFIHDMIALFSPVSKDELVKIMKFIFDTPYYDLSIVLPLLESLGLVKKVDEYFVATGLKTDFYLIALNIDLRRLRANIINSYAKKQPSKLDILAKWTEL